MSKTIKQVTCLIVLIAILCTMVTAYDVTGIKVELDKKPLTFTDVQPLARNGRTYVPFRAIFESLGANVDYIFDTKTVVAERNGKKVEFVIGNKNVEVTENKKTNIVVTDAPSFAMNNRTLVPVRFAAQCLGLNVGWDQQAKTVILTDIEKKLSLYQGQFTIMNKYVEFVNDFRSTNYTFRGTLNTDIKAKDNSGKVVPLASSGTISGVLSKSALNATVDTTTNIDELTKNISKEYLEKNKAMLEALKQDKTQYIADLTTNKAYIKTKLLNLLSGRTGDIWYENSFRGITESNGINAEMHQLMQLSNGDNFEQNIKNYLSSLEITDKNDTQIEDTIALIGSVFTDSKFKMEGLIYKATGTFKSDNNNVTIETVFNAPTQTITGYTFTVTSQQDDKTEKSIMSLSPQKTFKAISSKVTNTAESNSNLTLNFVTTFSDPSSKPQADETIVKDDNISEFLW